MFLAGGAGLTTSDTVFISNIAHEVAIFYKCAVDEWADACVNACVRTLDWLDW